MSPQTRLFTFGNFVYNMVTCLLLMLLLTSISGLACPKECICNQRSADCSSALLWDVPQDIPVEIVSLDLAYNNLTILPDDTFQTLFNLVTLLVHNSAVETVEPDAFRGLSVLGLLDLHNNCISHLHPGLFRHNPALSTLNLSGNKIHNIIGGIFSENPVLSQVYLAGNPLNSPVNWLALGSFTPLPLRPKFCDPSDSLNHIFPASKMFDRINVDRNDFKAIGVTNVIVYKLNNVTWAVLETPDLFPVLCLCNDLLTWILCGEEMPSREVCTPRTIIELFVNNKCEYFEAQQGFTTAESTEQEIYDEAATVSQEVSSTSKPPDYKPHISVDRNILVLCVAVVGVLVIIWTMAYLVFFHGKRNKQQRNSTSVASSLSPPGGSPLSLPDNVAFNPAAASRLSATPDMLLTIRGGSGVNRDHILYSSLNTIAAVPSWDAQDIYSEVQDRTSEFERKN